jgi:threonine/homoserine/homoserine lactone efflux protein
VDLPVDAGLVASVVAFGLGAAVVVLLPGPDSLLMLRSILGRGRRDAAATAAGILTGLVVWAASAAVGLAALLRASEVGYTALRLAGAVYLATVGVRLLRGRAAADPEAAPRSRRGSLLGTGFVAGLATNLLNPKVGVFFVTFLPGFVPEGAPVGPTSLLLGALYVAETAAYFAALVLLVGPVTRVMRSARVRRGVDRLSGVVFLAFGAHLAADS